ncbi:nitroreductase family deazaflavin-dependent oxidoreductase [Kribbella sp. NPDC051770]|uniref:nitroreductase family deazaflavin-dependent oxidoreductase n=1 Tax=Kribbella sp. NPDC051770 TaxID=3155413 RepID=UPI00344176B9
MPPKRFPRRLARAPIPLFKHGLGGLLGPRVLMLQHRGRRSGLARYVVLEVVGRTPEAVTVVSGYAGKAQWFRNVQADPAVRVWTGRRVDVAAHAEVLPADEARSTLEDYRQHHRRAARALGKVLGIEDLTSDEPLPPDIADRLPLVRLAYDD